MAYATQMDLENVWGTDVIRTLSDQNKDGVADQEAIDDALRSASSVIDGYLAVRYQVPLPNAPALVRDYCVDIAVYRLGHGLKITSEMRQRYEDAIEFLKLVAQGKASIGLDTDADDLSDDQSSTIAGSTQFLERA